MKNRIISIALLLCMAINIFALVSCSTETSGDADTDTTGDTLDIELSQPPMQERAIIHMIQPVDELEGWQAGKTEPSAFLYIDDMMKVFDELEWKTGEEEALISGDYDFRINLYRNESELLDYEEFITRSDIIVFEKDDAVDGKISVQYLINYADKTVNMRLFDYSAEVFDIYAQMNDYQLRVLVLCLKYYFGAQN